MITPIISRLDNLNYKKINYTNSFAKLDYASDSVSFGMTKPKIIPPSAAEIKEINQMAQKYLPEVDSLREMLIKRLEPYRQAVALGNFSGVNSKLKSEKGTVSTLVIDGHGLFNYTKAKLIKSESVLNGPKKQILEEAEGQISSTGIDIGLTIFVEDLKRDLYDLQIRFSDFGSHKPVYSISMSNFTDGTYKIDTRKGLKVFLPPSKHHAPTLMESVAQFRADKTLDVYLKYDASRDFNKNTENAYRNLQGLNFNWEAFQFSRTGKIKKQSIIEHFFQGQIFK